MGGGGNRGSVPPPLFQSGPPPFLAPPAERQRSFSNTDLSVCLSVRPSVRPSVCPSGYTRGLLLGTLCIHWGFIGYIFTVGYTQQTKCPDILERPLLAITFEFVKRNQECLWMSLKVWMSFGLASCWTESIKCRPLWLTKRNLT